MNFLDVAVIKNPDGSLITNWYQKPSSSGQYLNYFSKHPLRHKVGVINGLVDRAVLLSDKSFKAENLVKVKNILTNNFYPFDLIDKCISNQIFVSNNRQILDQSGVEEEMSIDEQDARII